MGKPAKQHTKKNKGEYEWSGEIKRIIPLKENHCYIEDEKGKLHHVERGTDRYFELLRHLDTVMYGKITTELERLGWDVELEVLNDRS